MIIDNSKGLTKILADEGKKKITNSERSFFSDFIYLGKNDSLDNYEEVGREIWKHFIEENPDVIELQEQVKDLKNIDDITMTALAEADTNANTNIDIILNAINELYLMLEPILLKGGE